MISFTTAIGDLVHSGITYLISISGVFRIIQRPGLSYLESV